MLLEEKDPFLDNQETFINDTPPATIEAIVGEEAKSSKYQSKQKVDPIAEAEESKEVSKIDTSKDYSQNKKETPINQKVSPTVQYLPSLRIR